MNKSGIKPQSFRILVMPLVVDEKTAGGLILPQDVKQKDEWAQTRGTIVEMGPEAFDDYNGAAPVVGDLVFFNRYAGANTRVDGNDGEEYWIIKDADILATIERSEP